MLEAFYRFNITGISRELLNPGLWKLWTIHWSHHVPTTKSTPFMVREDEGDTKEGHGKFMKNALYVQRYGKRHLSGWSDSEKIKSVALAIVELRESEGIRQLVS